MINLLSKLWDKVSLTKDLSCEEDCTTIDNLYRLREQHEEEINQLKVKLKDTITMRNKLRRLFTIYKLLTYHFTILCFTMRTSYETNI